MPTVACPRCGAPNDVKPSSRQKLARCLGCGSPIIAPGLPARPSRWPLVGKVALAVAVAAGVIGLMGWAAVLAGAFGE